jgi:hypothetical protein
VVDPPALVCTVGTTVLRYQLRCIEDLHQMLKERGDWVPLGSADGPLLETLGLAEVEHNPRNNRMRAIGPPRCQ